MPKIMKADRVINSEALNLEFILNENNRKDKEVQRIIDENTRKTDEQTRITNENKRIQDFQQKMTDLENTDTAQFNNRVVSVETQLQQITHFIEPSGQSDDTITINQVLQDFDHITFKKGVYNINAEIGVVVPSNKTVEFHDGAILKCIPNNLSTYNIINLSGVQNVKINNANIMGDRELHIGTSGEWGAGIGIYNNCINITITNPFIEKCWGDGFYISSATNLKITNPLVDNCRRNGITVISCDGLHIVNPETRNMQGIEPETGIDLEPNLPTEYLWNVLIENPYSHHNAGSGLDVLGKTIESIQWKNIVIKNITSQYNDTGIRFETGGDITVDGGDISNNSGTGFELARNIRNIKLSKVNIFNNGKRGIGAGLTAQNIASYNWQFNSCNIFNNSQLQVGTYDGMRLDSDSDTFPLDNVCFSNCLIYDNQDIKTQRYGFTVGTELRVTNFNFVGNVKTGVVGKYLSNNRSYVDNGKLNFTKNIDIPSVPANSRIYVDITQIGVISGAMTMSVPEGDLENGIMWNAIARTDSVRLFIANVTTSPIDPLPRNWRFNIINI